MKDINYKQYLTEKTTPHKLNITSLEMINTIGKQLRNCRQVSDVETYLTALHLICLANSQGNDMNKQSHFVHMADMVLKTLN